MSRVNETGDRRTTASSVSEKTGGRFPLPAPKLTCSELTAPRGEYAALPARPAGGRRRATLLKE